MESNTAQVSGHICTALRLHSLVYHLSGYIRQPPFSNVLYPGDALQQFRTARDRPPILSGR
jgi:hypothetical protein